MLKSPILFAISILVALLSWANVAKATESSLELSFALPTTEQSAPAATPVTQNLTLAKAVEPVKSIAISESALPNDLVRPQDLLPPIEEEEEKETSTVSGEQSISVQFLKDSLQLPDGQPKDERTAILPSSPHPLNERAMNNIKNNALENTALQLDDWIFEGGSQSLVAHTVGSAEGTRHWDGERTRAYYGHQDPGNGVWNLGTFSYQHEANSPEEADEKQIKRLKHQGFQLEEQAAEQGIQLSLVEKLNGLDLANQAPLAALGKGGYVERLAQAQRLALQGEEAIAWARTRSYLDPDTKSWDAPGLGNNLHSISQDQARRMSAIDQALRAYNQTNTTGLAQLKDIHLEANELDRPGFNDLANEFSLSADSLSKPSTALPSTASPSTASKSLQNSEQQDAWSMSDEVTFVLPPAENTAATTTQLEDEIAIAPPPLIAPPVQTTQDTPVLQASSALPSSNLALAATGREEQSQAAVPETELPLPAPLTQTDLHGNRPAPNPSWWHTEDKLVQKK